MVHHQKIVCVKDLLCGLSQPMIAQICIPKSNVVAHHQFPSTLRLPLYNTTYKQHHTQKTMQDKDLANNM
jgi:hypothetical protein